MELNWALYLPIFGEIPPNLHISPYLQNPPECLWDETPKSDKIKLKRELPYNNKECFIINSPDDVEITKAKEKKPLRW